VQASSKWGRAETEGQEVTRLPGDRLCKYDKETRQKGPARSGGRQEGGTAPSGGTRTRGRLRPHKAWSDGWGGGWETVFLPRLSLKDTIGKTIIYGKGEETPKTDY